MNEFKIKTGLILGSPPTQPVTGITDSSNFSITDSSTLATVKAIAGFVETQLNPINASIVRIDASLNDTVDGMNLFIPSASIGTGLVWHVGYLDVSVASGGSSTLAGLLDVSISDVSDFNMIRYDGASSKWINIAPAEASLYFWSLDVALLRESSIGTGLVWNEGMLDVSIVGGDPSALEVWNQIYQLDASIVQIDASLEEIWVKFGYVDTSLVAIDSSIFDIWTKINYIDTSLVAIDSSIFDIWAKFGYVDTSLSDLDTSINDIWLALNDFIDGDSFYLLDSCIGSSLVWNNGYLDVSFGNTDSSILDIWSQFGYVDASLVAIDSSIFDIWTKFGYVDTSLVAIDSSIFDIWSEIGILAASSPHVANGLQILGDGSIGLGGNLTENTTISLSGNSLSILGANNTTGIVIDTNGDITIANQTSQGPLISLIGDKLTIDSLGGDSLVMTKGGINPYSTIFTAGTGSPGIQYNADYSLLFIDRSLIDKGYAITLQTDLSTQVNGRLDNVDISLGAIDSSIFDIWSKFGNVDTSLVAIDSSILDIWLQLDQLDASIIRMDASLNDTLDAYTIFLPNASLGSGLIWNAGYLDVSAAGGGGVSQAAFDSSISAIDNSINELYTMVLDSSITKIGDQTVDGSWRLIIDTSGNLSVQKRISSVWVEKGNFN